MLRHLWEDRANTAGVRLNMALKRYVAPNHEDFPSEDTD